MLKYYVYIYLDPLTPCKKSYESLDFSFLYEPFYVGKGNGSRDINHMKQYRLNKKSYLSNKIKKIIRGGSNPYIIRIYENLSESDSLKFEKILISSIGRVSLETGTLVNITDGGEGTSGLKHTKESRLKIKKKLSYFIQESVFAL